MLAEVNTTFHGVDTCKLIDFPIVASGQLPQPFWEWLGEANDQMLSVSQTSAGRFWTRTSPFWGWDRHLKDVSTSSRRHLWHRHLGSKMAALEMMSSKTWGGFLDPYWGGGAKWRRFRSPSWMTSFAEPEMRSSKMTTGSAAILRLRLNGGPKKHPLLLISLVI